MIRAVQETLTRRRPGETDRLETCPTVGISHPGCDPDQNPDSQSSRSRLSEPEASATAASPFPIPGPDSKRGEPAYPAAGPSLTLPAPIGRNAVHSL